MNYHEAMRLNELILASLEGDLSDRQRQSLNQRLIEDPEAAGHYLNLIRLYAELSPYGDVGCIGVGSETADSSAKEYDRLLHFLAEDENTAPALTCRECRGESPREPIRVVEKVERQKMVYTLSRSSQVMLAAAFAASLVIVLFLRMTPPAAVQVATVVDSLNAVFDGNYEMAAGTRLAGGRESLWLQKGIVKIAFDYGAEMVIEAPAEFTLRSADDMTLHSGRVFVHVPGRSKGFRVNTPSATVIDLGTEFGIKVDYDGSSDVHMLKGRASLIPGVKGQTGEGQILPAGQARQVDTSGRVERIAVKREAFVHDINSRAGIVWRGQREIDLADVVCGGSGFGTGDPYRVIDPANGNVTSYVDRGQTVGVGSGTYHRVDASAYIDGVFVPDGSNGPIQISSDRTMFDGCPPTSGCYRKAVTVLHQVYESEAGALAVNDSAYGYPHQPAISMHANMGITFDLEAIRNNLRRVEITYFEALCAIADQGIDNSSQAGKADFWVLIDGQVRSHISGAVTGFSKTVRVAIAPDDRFLTLMTTDHRNPEESDPIHSDRCFFGRPAVGLDGRNY